MSAFFWLNPPARGYTGARQENDNQMDMKRFFNTVGLIGKANHNGTSDTITLLHDILSGLGYEVLVEERVAGSLPDNTYQSTGLMELGEQCDLAIVVGGDGNMLGAARVLARFNIAVVGVNRGNLGFLTDLSPDSLEPQLTALLDGKFHTEQRFLLKAEVHRHKELKSANSAVNEVVLHPGKVAHMIEFEVSIDEQFVYRQRSDGLIVSSPTGSTAYSLSGGGPILSPDLNAITLVPMFPHTLSSRPLVVGGDSQVKLKIPDEAPEAVQISCDGQITLEVLPGDEVIIRKSSDTLRLLHPLCHNYYEVLRSKLGWSEQKVVKRQP